MVHPGDVPQNLMKILSTAVSTALVIAVFFILQYLFNLDFNCSCRPGVHRNDVLFLAAPPLILTLIVASIEPLNQKRIISHCRNYCCNNYWSSIGMFLMTYLYLSAVWVSTVLFDGDWYICLLTNLNTEQTGIPCKKNLTYEETLTRTDYKNDSLDWGFAVISGYFVLWHVFSFFEAKFISWKMQKRSSVCTWEVCTQEVCTWEVCCPSYNRLVYEELLSEEVSSHLTEELGKIAKKRAKELCKEHVKTIRDVEIPDETPDETPDDTPMFILDE